MRVHLVNPSHVSFGVAVITPRWLYVLAAATGTEWGDPLIVDETLEPSRRLHHRARRRRRHRHPHRQRPPRLRDRHAGARARRLGRLRRHSRHALSRRSRTSSAARTPSSRATAIVIWQQRRPRLRGRQAAAHLRRRTHRGRPVHPRALGPAARRTATCGRRCRPCAAARSTARSARSGAPTARSRASAASIASSRRSSSCGAAGSASSRSPTTTSIR